MATKTIFTKRRSLSRERQGKKVFVVRANPRVEPADTGVSQRTNTRFTEKIVDKTTSMASERRKTRVRQASMDRVRPVESDAQVDPRDVKLIRHSVKDVLIDAAQTNADLRKALCNVMDKDA